MSGAILAICVRDVKPTPRTLAAGGNLAVEQPIALTRLLEVASVPATIVNWAGAQTSTEEWCGYLGELTGLEPAFEETSWALPSITIDTTRMHELIGPAEVDWHDGFRRMVQARMPSLLRG